MAGHVTHAADHALIGGHTWGPAQRRGTVLGARWGHVSSRGLGGAVVRMLQGVALQEGAVSERAVAHVTLEGALGTVRAHVHV